MKHKTSELTGDLLARAAAMASGYRIEKEGREWVVWLPPEATPDKSPIHSFGELGWRPDMSWAHAGPIIDRERISLIAPMLGRRRQLWTAGTGATQTYDGLDLDNEQEGDTALIAAMRAYVASKLGDEVDL